MFPAAGLDLSIDQSAVESLLAVEPTAVDSPETVTVARNVFLPLTTACRYACGYCTFYDPPGAADLLDPDAVRSKLRRGREAGCTEALFTFGDDPDERYTAIHEALSARGFESVQEYLRAGAKWALDAGLLPHGNPGEQTREQLAAVADVMASMGVMLETTADVPAHAGPRGKSPADRLRTVRAAGELSVPFTTGILVGIGEDWRDRAESLLAIRALHERYGHIQEVIVQPVTQNERWQGAEPGTDTLKRVVAMARTALPPAVAVQIPPNLAPVEPLLRAGADDLGGVSPVTVDHVNPEAAWPAFRDLAATVESMGIALRERLPVRERFLPASGLENEWIGEPVGRVIYGDTPAGQHYRAIIGDTDGPRT
ncbi:7,8-didemethyl-8-hydroxy-5-deazariboflavin synthase subunit CofG [Halodesulfurarchaeum formicicum]|uniref:7,8-didemethyl-8-hydroxy-5-deazariboflavin synthase n=1 Tax=Halodesulfurarchaeum formicicum TaxID=1873524 RepID=A0A1D8S700_9EURY|nr:7,8-didemethyl-8-hydroxy-5-deazariboflavin synthase subunit CofG [Halodesulfurarchaeum formicicum]AOW81131.1 7,8-didemethyl-8-hydroxy-5-deazariboflavin synthase subunit CofG [Halodesulfurarchaeum formicicum]